MRGPDASSPLDGVSAVDATTSLGWYAGRLLADLGADVVRLEDAAVSRDQTLTGGW